METKKNYVGNAKQRDWKFWAFFSLSVNVDKLQDIKNEKGYARLTMNLNREPDQYGNTHSIVEDTWKPAQKDLPPIKENIHDIANEMFDNRTNINDVPF